MVTTFFGPRSFGGDAAYVERLSRALARRGHDVEVVHCADAFDAVRGDHPLRPIPEPRDVRVHTLSSRFGRLSPLWSHQLGSPGPKQPALERIVERGRFDVLHFHNVSLMGAPRVLTIAPQRRAVRLMSAHEHWLTCPTSLLWRFDRASCERPRCAACTLHARRPVQLWRYGHGLERALESLDAVVVPSLHSLRAHRERGIRARLVKLPYFLPSDWAAQTGPRRTDGRPYLVAAGRLIKAKGFHRAIEAMDRLAHVDLLVAGTGPYEGELKALAASRPNVRLLGLVDADELARLFRSALALVIPSLFPETFGYVAVEAFSMGAPALVHREGALPELIEHSAAGFVYRDEDELVAAVRRLSQDPELRRRLGDRAQRAVSRHWSEEGHLDAYLGLVESLSPRSASAPVR